MGESKKTFKKFVDDYVKKELWTPHVMVIPTTEGFWYNVRQFLITFCQDSPEDTTVAPGVVEQISTKEVNDKSTFILSPQNNHTSNLRKTLRLRSARQLKYLSRID